MIDDYQYYWEELSIITFQPLFVPIKMTSKGCDTLIVISHLEEPHTNHKMACAARREESHVHDLPIVRAEQLDILG